MHDLARLKQNIQQLESEASLIETDIESFFISLEKQPQTKERSVETSLFPPSTSFEDYEHFHTISGQLAAKHRELITRYEKWYNKAHILIQTYYPNKEAEFLELHNSTREPYTGPATKFGTGGIVTKNITTVYGISELLQFDPAVRYSSRTSHELIQKITGLFARQRSILLSLSEILPEIRLIEDTSKETVISDSKKSEHDGSFPPNFKIALSFPGEYRDTIRKIADGLVEKLGQNTVFYDKYFEGELARLNLDDVLQEIYRNRSELIIVFLCQEYEKKKWCGLEWRAIKDLIISRKDQTIMPVRLEDFDITGLKGLFSYDGYLDMNNKHPSDVVTLIINRYKSMGTVEETMEKSSDIFSIGPESLSIDSFANKLNPAEDIEFESITQEINGQNFLIIEGIIRNKSMQHHNIILCGDIYDSSDLKLGVISSAISVDPLGKSKFSMQWWLGEQHIEVKCNPRIEYVWS